MSYNTWYGNDRQGTRLCADHKRLLAIYDPMYIDAFETAQGASLERTVSALNQQLEADMQTLLDEARKRGDRYIDPDTDYGLFT